LFEDSRKGKRLQRKPGAKHMEAPNEDWMSKYREFVAYKEKNGTTRVRIQDLTPATPGSTSFGGSTFNMQRRNYKNLAPGGEKKRLLDEVGFEGFKQKGGRRPSEASAVERPQKRRYPGHYSILDLKRALTPNDFGRLPERSGARVGMDANSLARVPRLEFLAGFGRF